MDAHRMEDEKAQEAEAAQAGETAGEQQVEDLDVPDREADYVKGGAINKLPSSKTF